MDETYKTAARPSVEFGDLHLHPDDRRLTVGGVNVEIGGRAFEILRLLVTSPGQTISHREFRERVWPDTVVEDGNLRVHVTMLRKILARQGDGSIQIRSISGRGYRLLGAVSSESAKTKAICEDNALTADADGLIGRGADVSAICELLSQKRIVSIVGPGGIGKTSVAQAVLAETGKRKNEPIAKIELSSVGQPELVESTIASAFGLLNQPALTPLDAVTDFLRGSPHIVLLDCCEHIIEAVATVVEKLHHALRTLTILTTTREPLRVSNEWVYRLQALSVPHASESQILEVATQYSAVKLFTERATSSQGTSFRISQENIRDVCDICRTLDGLPLAIELAASQLHMFGTRKLLHALGNRFDLLTRGQRTALPRHKTLRATIDWSYETLTEEEQLTLRRVSLFKAAFTIEQTTQLLDAAGIDAARAMTALVSLVDKSLVLSISEEDASTFRLLDSTRAYGLEKLRHCGEYDAAAENYARFFLSLFTEPAQWSARNAVVDPLASDKLILDDVRHALEWALSPHGNASVGVALSWACAPLFYQLSLFDEYRERVNMALSTIETARDSHPDASFRLQLALAQADFLTQSLKKGISTKAFHAALALAVHYQHEARQTEVLYGTIVMTVMAGDYEGADSLCKRLGALTHARNTGLPLYHRLQALVNVQTGALEQALQNTQLSLSLYGPRHVTPKLQDPARYDARAALTSLEARALWLAGHVDDAADVAAQSVEETMTLEHDLSLCCSLASGACPVACWRGDVSKLELYLGMLETLSAKFTLTNWQDQALCYGYALPDRKQPKGHRWWTLFEHCAPSAHETLVTINWRLLTPLAIDRAKSGAAGWATSEILRALGERQVEKRSDNDSDPENLFRRALTIAKSQGALSFELRAATSLARSLHTRGSLAEAEDILLGPLSRFTQGADTQDLRMARSVLSEIHGIQKMKIGTRTRVFGQVSGY